MKTMTAFLKTMPSVLGLILATFTPVFGQEVMKIKHGCNFSEEETNSERYIFEASNEATNIVNTLLQNLGLTANGFILKESDCKNALATSEGIKRYILYNPVFLQQFKKDVKSKWVAYCVLAHEIAHHIDGHDLETNDVVKRKEQELKADKFAGFWLFKMGATLEEAQAGINTLPLENETTTHPPKNARLVAVTNGWTKSKDASKESTDTNPNRNTNSSPSDNTSQNLIQQEKFDFPSGSKVVYKALFSDWPTLENENGKSKPTAYWNGYELEAYSNTWVGPGKSIILGSQFNSDFICDIYFKVLEGNPSINLDISDDGQNYSAIQLFLDFWESGKYTLTLQENYLKNNFYSSVSKYFSKEREAIDDRIASTINLKDINKISFYRQGNIMKLYLNNYLLKTFEPFYINFKKIGIGTAFRSKLNLTDLEVKTSK